MKISIVSGFFLPVPAVQGGAMEKIWHRFAQLFAARGHTVTLISRRWPGLAHDEEVDGVRYLRLPGMNHRRQLPLNLVLDFVWGLRVLRALPPGDAVICNTVALPVFLRRLKPAAGHVCVSLGRMPKGQTRFYGGVACLMAPSLAVADQVRLENPRLAPRIWTLPNPIDWPLHARAEKKAERPAPIIIGFVGRINPEKGLEQLLDAAGLLASRPNLPPWRVRLLGPVAVSQGGGGDAYLDQLRATYQSALGGQLEFLPPEFDPVRLAQQYGKIDIFCYPSLAAKGEGLSVAPLEAMAAGAVPVLSRLACYEDVIEEGKNGFRFNHAASRDQVAHELADQLATLLLHDDQRKAMAAAAQQTARRFDYEALAEGVLTQLSTLAADGPREETHS